MQSSEQVKHDIAQIIAQGRVVRKPVNVNPGLDINWGIIFSCLNIYFISNIWCSLWLLQFKTKGQTK